MATNPPSDPSEVKDFDFWEFVACAKCRMPFVLDNGSATIPFWLTECGHVVCNNHLNRDQSCSQCGAQDIQLAPLQREMEPPMSDWFRSIPSALESVAFTVKFQQEAMASQVRYHKSRHQQLRQLIERFKRENAELKRSNEILQNQNEQFHRQMEHQHNSLHGLTPNGKRRRLDTLNGRTGTDSSPRSITTPIGPDRLTLLPGQQVPELSSHRQQEAPRHHHFPSHIQNERQYVNQDPILGKRPISSRSLEHQPQQRPTSGRPIEQYAYTPQANNVFHAPQLTRAQAAPKIFQRASTRQNEQQHREAGPSGPPRPAATPSSSRFKPAIPIAQGPIASASSSRQVRQPTLMGPPPTPQHVRNGIGNGRSVSSNTREQVNKLTAGERINDLPQLSAGHQHGLLVTSGLSNPGQQTSSRRFFPDTGSNPASFSSHGNSSSNAMRGSSRAAANLSNSNQRFHFLPEGAQRGNFG